MSYKPTNLLTLITLFLLLSACSLADNKPPPTNTPSSEDRLAARHKDEFDIPRPNCFQSNTAKVGTEVNTANQALLRATANLLSDPLAQELNLDTLAAIHRELSGRGQSLFFQGDNNSVLIALAQNWCNALTSHPYSSFLVYVVNRTGVVWPMGRIGSVQNEDVHWTGDSWVMIPDTIGSPNPYDNKFAVWHIEKRDSQWANYEFEPEAQYIADVPGPKVVASRLKPEWRRVEGGDEVIFEFTLLTGSPPCENVLDKELFYQTYREIRVIYQRQDGVYMKVDEELLVERVGESPFQMSVFTKCSDKVSNTDANTGKTDGQD